KANNDTFTVVQGSQPKLLNVLANDADPDPVVRYDAALLPIVACTSPAAGNGTAKVIVDSRGLMGIYYTPPPNPCGATVKYTICDRYGAQSAATVTVNVVASQVNSRPTVSAGTAQTVNSLYPQPTTVLLQGTVTDDGQSDLSLVWSCVNPPGA